MERARLRFAPDLAPQALDQVRRDRAQRRLAAADCLEVLDRIAERVPELHLAQHSGEWTTLDDGHEALLVDGGGIDGGNGTYFANCGEDVHAVGMLDPIVPGHVGCIVIRPDGSRYLARAVPDPLAQPRSD